MKKFADLCACIALCFLSMTTIAQAQLAPVIGYMYPSGGQAGTTVEVTLGGYDWTPDMQIFLHDPRLKLEIIGPPSPVLVPDPPYWFEAKARGPAWPLPREFKARLTIPADVKPGLVRWQVANANGASPLGTFCVGAVPEASEDAARKNPQPLPELPVTVSGQIRKIEEVDRFEFQVPQAGPVTIELIARQLGAPLHSILQVRDSAGKLVVDVADSEGRDLTTTFAATAGMKYVLSLHDLDFAGDRSYVYRLQLTRAPQVQAAYPSAGKRGETRSVEFVGIGVATGAAQLESVRRDVAFPADPALQSFEYRLETPFGVAPARSLLLSSIEERAEPASGAGIAIAQVPVGITSTIETRFGSQRFTATLAKDGKYRIAASSRAWGGGLDLDLSVLGPDGKEVATSDDVEGSTDPLVLLAVPADGVYTIIVTDRSGKSGTKASGFRLSIEPQQQDFTLTVPPQLSVPIAGKIPLVIKAARQAGFAEPIKLTLSGLPEGVSAPAELVIPGDKGELAIELNCAATAPASAALVKVVASGTPKDLSAIERSGTLLLASVMKPRVKITPEGLDDVRKVHRGSTFLAPLLIERLEGYQGEIVLEMTSLQQRHRQGLASDEFTVPVGATRVEYPIFVPEWMETTKTSRMIMNGVIKLPDPKGTVRTLVQRMELRVGILPEGALMKLANSAGEPTVQAGGELRIPLTLSRAPEFREASKIELLPEASVPATTPIASAEPLTMPIDQSTAMLVARLSAAPSSTGPHVLRIRATSLKEGRWPVISETTVTVHVTPKP